MVKVGPPKVILEPLEPFSIEDINTLLATCQHGVFTGDRDHAIFMFLLDTGARARELCGITIEDIDASSSFHTSNFLCFRVESHSTPVPVPHTRLRLRDDDANCWLALDAII